MNVHWIILAVLAASHYEILVLHCKKFVLDFKKKHVKNIYIFFCFFEIFVIDLFVLATHITSLYKDQTLLVSITGRPDQVRLAQVQLLREIQKSVKHVINVPFDFHRFIIGPRGVTLKNLEQETLTRVTIPPQDQYSNEIVITGAKDNVKLCEQKILELYHAQLNRGFERLSIPSLYHPWIRNMLVDELHSQLNVTIDVPPMYKQTDEITIRGERELVEQAKKRIEQFYNNLVIIKTRISFFFVLLKFVILGRKNCHLST